MRTDVNEAIYTVTPKLSYAFHPNRYGVAVYWVRGLIEGSKKLRYSLITVNQTDSDGKNLKGLPVANIHLGKPPYLPIWPLNSHKTLALFRGGAHEHSILKHYILRNDPIPVSTALINHSPLDPYICSVGKVRVLDENHKLVENKRLIVTNGLGHGKWRDDHLTAQLQNRKDFADGFVTWLASPNGWTMWQKEVRTHVRVQWDVFGEPVGGSLMLLFNSNDPKGQCRLLAVYKPRCASWLLEETEKVETSLKEGRRSDEDAGRLGLMVGNFSQAIMQHIWLTVLAIEEQVRLSKGFKGTYHGGWAS